MERAVVMSCRGRRAEREAHGRVMGGAHRRRFLALQPLNVRGHLRDAALHAGRLGLGAECCEVALQASDETGRRVLAGLEILDADVFADDRSERSETAHSFLYVRT